MTRDEVGRVGRRPPALIARQTQDGSTLAGVKVLAFVGLVALCTGGTLLAQEKPVPNDSSRISIPGCARDRQFVVAEPPEDEPIRSDIQPGRRFRLNGPKKLLEEIGRRERTMIEVTGLVRKGQLSGPGGIAIAGGRIRIGGATPQSPISSPGRDPMYNVVVMDVESWRPLPGTCEPR
jgi:hypothetical protein